MFIINIITYGVQYQYIYKYVLLYWYLRQNMQHFWIFISYYYVTGSFKNCILKSIKPYHEKYNGPSCSHSITFVPRRQIWLRFFGNRIDSSCFDWCFKFRSCLFFLFKVGQIPFPGNHGLPTFPKLNESSGWKKRVSFEKKMLVRINGGLFDFLVRYPNVLVLAKIWKK